VKNEFLEKQNVELRKALDLSARGEISQALELIDAYIDCHPGSAPAYRAKAMALSVDGRYQNAAEAMRVAINFSRGDDPAYFVEFGEYLIELALFDDAYVVLTDAIDLIGTTGEFSYLQTALLARAVAAVKSGAPNLARGDLRHLDENVQLYCAGELWSKQNIVI